MATRRDARRGRAALATAFLAALALHLGLFAALEGRPELCDPEFGHRLRLIRAAGGRPAVIALGSSRTQMGLAPAELGVQAPVFNLGVSGAGPIQHLVHFRRLLRAGVRPERVLIEVLPALLHDERPAERAVDVDRLLRPDLAVIRPHCDDPRALERAWLSRWASPWTAARFRLVSAAAPDWLPRRHRTDSTRKATRPDGWLPYPWPEVPPGHRSAKLARARAEYARRLDPFAVSPGPSAALRQLLAECRGLGIPAAVYLMPEGPAFRSWYAPDARVQTRLLLDRLGVPVFDATDWVGEPGFADGHHLLRGGAVEFSRRFGPQCLAPWLAGGCPRAALLH